MLSKVDRELVHKELRLVVVDVFDVDREIQVALQRRRDAQVERLHPQQVDLLPLPGGNSVPQSSQAHFRIIKSQFLSKIYLTIKRRWSLYYKA